MKTLYLAVIILSGLHFVLSGFVCAAEKIIIPEDPSKASTVFIIELSLEKTVRISEKIKTSKEMPWNEVEEKVNLMSGSYQKVLVKLGKQRRLLVCVFEHKDQEISIPIYRHFPIYGNQIFLPSGKKISISKLL